MILRGQTADEFTGHHQCLLIGQRDGLARLDGMDGGGKSGKAYHGCEHDVNGLGLHNLVEGLCSGIDLHVGQVVSQPSEFIVT